MMDNEIRTPIFYVTVQRGHQTQLALGPFDSKDEAQQWMDEAQRVGKDRDPSTAFDSWGITKATVREGRSTPRGRFNEALGL